MTVTPEQVSSCFNPLPSPKRGEIGDALVDRGDVSVSIRSPHRSEGRFAEEDVVADEDIGFNPLPSPKRGEILFGISMNK